ncbi:MAG: PAS domain-containing protein [Polaribacter sp.]|nr:PAS domain-containing protein [Polaribacter sp.]
MDSAPENFNPENDNLRHFPNSILGNIIIGLSVIFSLAILINWYVDLSLLKFITGSTQMKFNTSFVILIASINLYIYHKKDKNLKIIFKLLSISSIIIGVSTLISYFGFPLFEIDNLFVPNGITPEKMSPAYAVCAISIGFGFLGLKSKNILVSNISRDLIMLVSLISSVVIISYVLLIPIQDKTIVFQTMSLLNSILFFLISLLLLFKKQNSLFTIMFKGTFLGSKIFRKTFPIIIIFPIVVANLLLLAIKEEWIHIDLGIVAYTVVLIPFLVMYFSRIALKLNETDKTRQTLEEALIHENLNLTHFNKALDVFTIIGITDANGIITYVNDSFCEISKYSKEEILGKTHKIIKSDYHDTDFFKNMWLKIKAGEVWVGEIKNRAKDGSYYWVDTTIIPFKNEENIITGFMSVRQVITKRKEKEVLMK